ncbi:MAG: glycoside hydrolase family 2 protein [Anaerolineae bacterium]
MHRRFATSQLRRPISLNGWWDFQVDPSDVGVGESWYSAFPDTDATLWVPGVWNTRQGSAHYEGAAWFRQRFTTGDCLAVVLHFGAVTHQANVWLDGEPVGDHYGGFLPFSFLLPHLPAGLHELVVRVDNARDMAGAIPPAGHSGLRYGGIFRSVWVEELGGPAHVATLRVTPVVKRSRTTLRVRAELQNLTERPLNETWTLFLDDVPIRSGLLHLDPRDVQVLLFAANVRVDIWSPEEPRLYKVRLVFGGDDVIERTGFREIRVDGGQVMLNGSPIHIRGIDRHEEHPDWGYAVPEHLIARDLDLIEELGANAIRGVHNPDDELLLDLCDERGILFMEGVPLSGCSQEQLAHDIMGDRASAMLWAMISRDVSHPCIWAWSLLEDCATDTPEGCAVVEQLAQTAHEADPTRPLTYASSCGVADSCLDMVDLICVNAACALEGDSIVDITAWRSMLSDLRQRVGDMPLLVAGLEPGAFLRSQAGGGDALDGQDAARRAIRDTIQMLLQSEGVAGVSLRQFADAYGEGSCGCLPGQASQGAGLLDAYRQPKASWQVLRALLAAEG